MTWKSHSWVYTWRKLLIQKHACTPVFVAVLSTIARTWKQPKCPPAEEWIKMRYVCTMGYYLAVKMAESVPFAEKHCCCCSVAQSRLTLCNPMDCSAPGFPVLRCLLSLLKLMSIESVMPSNHLILCQPLLLLPSIFPHIRVFSSESALHIRWPKNWITALCNLMKLWAMPCRATQDRQVMMKSSDKMWSTGEGKGEPRQHSHLENPMNSMKRQRYGWT